MCAPLERDDDVSGNTACLIRGADANGESEQLKTPAYQNRGGHLNEQSEAIVGLENDGESGPFRANDHPVCPYGANELQIASVPQIQGVD